MIEELTEEEWQELMELTRWIFVHYPWGDTGRKPLEYEVKVKLERMYELACKGAKDGLEE